MTISSLSSASNAWATTSTSGGRPPGGPSGPPPGGGPDMSDVSDLLGLSEDDLKAQLDSGKTLSDVAEAQGVTTDDLVSTIAASLPTTAPDGSTLDTTDMATKIANGERPQGPPPGPPPGERPTSGLSVAQSVDTLSDALGTTSEDLLARLTDGTGISDLLSSSPTAASTMARLTGKGVLADGYA